MLDTGSFRYLCSNRESFHDFEETANGECVQTGNSTTAGVTEVGKIQLELTLGRFYLLSNVMYVPFLSIELVSGALLNKARLKLVLKVDKSCNYLQWELYWKGVP